MPRDNSGILSANERKQKDTHPDVKGSATIDGVDYWLDGWNKKNDRGEFVSLSFKRKDAQRGPSAPFEPPPASSPWD